MAKPITYPGGLPREGSLGKTGCTDFLNRGTGRADVHGLVPVVPRHYTIRPTLSPRCYAIHLFQII